MNIIEKNEGRKIEYEASGTRLYLGDDELMLNLSKYQRDWPVHIDICASKDEILVTGTGAGLYYVAEIDIAPIRYADGEGAEDGESGGQALPLDMGDVILTLWSLDDPTPSPIDNGLEE